MIKFINYLLNNKDNFIIQDISYGKDYYIFGNSPHFLCQMHEQLGRIGIYGIINLFFGNSIIYIYHLILLCINRYVLQEWHNNFP